MFGPMFHGERGCMHVHGQPYGLEKVDQMDGQLVLIHKLEQHQPPAAGRRIPRPLEQAVHGMAHMMNEGQLATSLLHGTDGVTPTERATITRLIHDLDYEEGWFDSYVINGVDTGIPCISVACGPDPKKRKKRQAVAISWQR